MAKTLVTHERVLQLFSYDKETGLLTRKVTVHYNAKAGDIINSIDLSTGYINFNIDGRLYYGHRVAWFYVTKEWPNRIDHKNGVKHDNRWKNLRNGTQSDNLENLKAAKKHNSSGLLGAHKSGRLWEASITVQGVRHKLGRFNTAQEAHDIYMDAKRKLHQFNTL